MIMNVQSTVFPVLIIMIHFNHEIYKEEVILHSVVF
jgi:hypothetical protein